MKFRVYEENSQPVSNWSGGQTRELAIFPEDSAYLDRDFIWRLSTASSDREESSFSRLEGFDRILMVLEGQVVLAHGQERSVKLGEDEQDRFDGGIKTRCFGKLIKDYNLIMARGCEGSLEILKLDEDAKAIDGAFRDNAGKDNADAYRSYGFYCLDGYGVVSCGEDSRMIRPKTQAVIDLSPGENPKITVMGEGRCILAEVAFEAGGSAVEEPTEEMPGTADNTRQDSGEIPQGTSFASEYGTCLRLFARSNRWSKMIRRQGADKVYYDKVLSRALGKIERRYITSIVWILGCLLCFIPVFLGADIEACALGAVIFTIVHIFLIAPFIYWRMLPKPIGAHIKSTDQLDAFEKMHHEEDISSDPHFERLMSKYTSDDENYFTDEKSPLYNLVRKKK